MNEPLVSVVMAVCDGQEFLNIAIDTVLHQTHKNLELIIVDYGSSDNTPSIVANYADSRINYVYSKDNSFESALNQGIEIAKGKYVARMDQKDMSDPERLQKQVAYLVKTPGVALVGSNFDVIDENSNVVDRGSKPNQSEDLNPLWLIENPLANGSVMFVRKEALDQGGFRNREGIGNYNFWRRMGAKSKVAILPQRLYQIRVVPGQRVRGYKANLQQSHLGFNSVENYELWLRIVGGVKTGVKLSENKLFSPAAFSKSNASKMNNFGIEITNAVQNAWQDPSLTNTQRWLLEKNIEAFHTQLSTLRDSAGNRPSVSVVMSVYNGARYLGTAIDSILNQSFKDFEFIIIDDGSKDDSVSFIRKINDPRIRLIQQTNHGLNYSLNKGIRLARAPLIARMDQDDISLPSRFEKQVATLAEKPEVGMVSTFFTHVDEVTEKKGVKMAFPFKPLDVKRCFYMVNPIAHGSAMFRKSVWKTVGGFDPKYQPPDDFQLWTKIANVADIVIIPESLYLYRVSSTGMTATMSGLAEMAEIITNEYWLQGYKAKGLFAVLRDAKYYRNLDSQYAQQIYEQYKAQQLHIVNGLLPRQHIGAAIKMILAVVLLDKSIGRKHIRLILRLGKSTAKVILRRPRIIGNTLK